MDQISGDNKLNIFSADILGTVKLILFSVAILEPTNFMAFIAV